MHKTGERVSVLGTQSEGEEPGLLVARPRGLKVKVAVALGGACGLTHAIVRTLLAIGGSHDCERARP